MYKTYKNRDGELMIMCQNEGGTVISFMPDEANSDYQAYLAWVAEGNEPEIVEG